MEAQFNKIIELIKKTGDKCVVLDKNQEVYVVMSLKDYEKLVTSRSEVHDLTEEELLDKINRDIAIWRSSQEKDKESELEESIKEQFDMNKEEEDKEVAEDRYYFEPLE